MPPQHDTSFQGQKNNIFFSLLMKISSDKRVTLMKSIHSGYFIWRQSSVIRRYCIFVCKADITKPAGWVVHYYRQPTLSTLSSLYMLPTNLFSQNDRRKIGFLKINGGIFPGKTDWNLTICWKSFFFSHFERKYFSFLDVLAWIKKRIR